MLIFDLLPCDLSRLPAQGIGLRLHRFFLLKAGGRILSCLLRLDEGPCRSLDLLLCFRDLPALLLPVQVDRIHDADRTFAALQNSLLFFDLRPQSVQLLLVLLQFLQPVDAVICGLCQRQFLIIFPKICLQKAQFLLL